MVKNPAFLRTGRQIPNFSLLPREAWANWLLAVVLRDYFKQNITFAEDVDHDGVIYNKDTDEWFLTEHVSALRVPTKEAQLKNEARILNSIQKKIDRGPDYADGKRLVVFTEDAGFVVPE